MRYIKATTEMAEKIQDVLIRTILQEYMYCLNIIIKGMVQKS